MSTTLLQSRAVIALFETGQWRTIKRHKAETQAENARHGLRDEARVDVKICDHPALVALQSILSEARAEHYRLSLPAGEKGLRLLPGTRQLEHIRTMGELADKFNSLVSEFVAAYEDVKATAPARLNGLYVASQWPDVDTVRESFRFRTRYLPVPAMGQWDEWLAEASQEATTELRERFATAIRAVAVKLVEKNPIFRDSLMGNLKDLLDLAPDLNLRDDPEISGLVQAAKGLVVHDADTLREDESARKEVADRAEAICGLFKL